MMMELAEKIKFYRAKAGLSPRDLAKIASVSNEWVYKVENGDIKKIGVDKAQAVAQALQVDPSLFFSDKPIKQSSSYSLPKLNRPAMIAETQLPYISDPEMQALKKVWSELNQERRKFIVTIARKLSRLSSQNTFSPTGKKK